MNEWYAAAIRALCEQVGIQDWQAVMDAQQIEANGYTVSLLPHPSPSTSMAMYVELTNYPAAGDPDLLRHLLEANIATIDAGSAFALIPVRGTIAYRTQLQQVNTLNGGQLMSRILDLLAIAAQEFHRVMSRRTGHDRATAPRHRPPALQNWSAS